MNNIECCIYCDCIRKLHTWSCHLAWQMANGTFSMFSEKKVWRLTDIWPKISQKLVQNWVLISLQGGKSLLDTYMLVFTNLLDKICLFYFYPAISSIVAITLGSISFCWHSQTDCNCGILCYRTGFGLTNCLEFSKCFNI